MDMAKEDAWAKQNQAIRGYIMRALVRGHQNTLLVRQVTSALTKAGLISSPDATKHLDYLQEKGYIAFLKNKEITAYNLFRKDGIFKLTAKGQDLIEGTITDPGVDL